MKQQNKVAFAHIQTLIASLEFKFERVGETTVTGCWAFLPNGFQVGYGESACVDPNEYKQEDGEKYAKERCVVNASNKLWELEGYLLKITGQTSDGLKAWSEIIGDAGVIGIAKKCHETNRAYCQAIGDNSQLPWEECEEWQRRSAINGVHFILDNPKASPSASHDSWLEEKRADGWVYGEVKDTEKKTHPCFVPYEQLPAEQKAKDYLFKQTVLNEIK
ncbi:ryanodine receptor [Vibrio phage 1.151.O._10N.222.46.B1]|nr:ryanodine receptor [Vibrio phage 1.151.O._10N.222.46.B1]